MVITNEHLKLYRKNVHIVAVTSDFNNNGDMEFIECNAVVSSIDSECITIRKITNYKTEIEESTMSWLVNDDLFLEAKYVLALEGV